jgi:hypothetical protein
VDDENPAECQRCGEGMSDEDDAECGSTKCVSFRAWAAEHQDDPDGDRS